MIILSLDELKLIARKRGIKDYENKSEDDLIKILSEPKTKINFSKKRIEDIRKDFNKSRHMFSGSKIKQIRKNLYNIKNLRYLSRSKIKEIERNLIELEKKLSKKYYDYDDNKYKGIRDVENLFNQSTEEDYYKPIKIINSFGNKNNYIEYESRGDKNKNLSPKEYLDMIKPYLRDIINDHKTPMNLRVYLDNEVINDKTQFEEWKIQLTMLTNFISSKDSNDETRIIRTKSDNIEIMISSKTNEIIEELFKSLLQKFQKGSEKPQGGSEFVYNSVNSVHYQL